MDEFIEFSEDFLLDEKVKQIENIFINYPRLENIMQRIAYCHRYSKISAEPECLFIKGPSGVGKSTIFKQYIKQYPPKVTDIGTITPVLSATIPAPATVKSVSTALLSRLGDPKAERGTSNSQTHRLINLIRTCKIELIILDEFQHFIDSESNSVLLNVANWLKHLLNETKVPIILIGMPNSESIFKGTDQEQLSRRFASRETLSPFMFDTDDNKKEFRKFLKALDASLPFPQLSDLSHPIMAYRIHFATDGLAHYVMKLIKTASHHALLNGKECLDLECLSIAYSRHVQNAKRKENPFGNEVTYDSSNDTSKSNYENSSGEKSVSNRGTRKPKDQSISDVLSA